MKKEFVPKQEVFYKNQRARFLTNIDDDECVIEVPYESHYGDESYIEYGRLIVLKNQLNSSKIDFDKEFDTLQAKLNSLERNKTIEIENKVRQKEKEYNELVEKLKSIKPIKQLMEYLDGKSKYAIIQDYSDYKLLEMSELVTDDGSSSWSRTRKLRAFVIDRQEKNKFEFTVSSYSDGTGSTRLLFLFDNKEDAVNKYVELMKEKVKNSKSCIVDEKILNYWGISDFDLLANVELGKRQRKESELKEIEKKSKELEDLRNKYCVLEK